MPLPTSMSTGWVAQRAAVRFSALTTDPSFGLQIEVAPTSGFASSRNLVQRLPPSAANRGYFTVQVPFSTSLWFMRSKTWKLGQADSPYSTVASMTPQLISAALPNPGMEARRIAQFGTLTTALTKMLIFPQGALVPFQSTATPSLWAISAASAAVQVGSATTIFFIGSVILPVGVTVTKVTAKMYRASTKHLAVTQLTKVPSTGTTATVMFSITHSTVGLQSKSSSALSELVSTAASYNLVVKLKSTAGAGARFFQAAFQYTVPKISLTY